MSGDGQPESTEREQRSIGPPPSTPRPAWWLPGPHLPTIFAKFARKISMPPTVREQLATPDGDVISVERANGIDGRPRVILFHGLEGGTHSTYARGIFHAAARCGWWADLVLWRTCDGKTVNRVRRSYHSGASDDLGFALEAIVNSDPRRITFAIGVSLGGNALLKWLGERGKSVPPALRAASAVSVPFDLAAASRKIERGFSRVYTHFFLKSLKAKALAKIAQFPDIADRGAVERAQTLWAFDDAFTAPLHGFANAADYYTQCSSLAFLSRVRIPTLLLNAQDDPFLPRRVLSQVGAVAVENSYLECVFPRRGGHTGFISGASPRRAQYWMEDYVLNWLDQASGVLGNTAPDDVSTTQN
ncbi:MAG TPA: alpha/beta fold hydrolase [Gemmatimonadaceae bacterium]|nr:alpha/beta fold hydrolase [Gemmatimonadaceae bacterium]